MRSSVGSCFQRQSKLLQPEIHSNERRVRNTTRYKYDTRKLLYEVPRHCTVPYMQDRTKSGANTDSAFEQPLLFQASITVAAPVKIVVLSSSSNNTVS